MKCSLSILFWLNKSKANPNSLAPIYARVTVNGKRAEIAIGEKELVEKWNSKTGSVKGNKEEARRTNVLLDQIKAKIRKIYNSFSEEGKSISSAIIKSLVTTQVAGLTMIWDR